MKKQKLYFQRHYDQWKGLDIAIEEEVDGYGLYIQIPDTNMEDGSVTAISADFEGVGSIACTVVNEEKRIIRVEVPKVILANNGLYRVSFSCTPPADICAPPRPSSHPQHRDGCQHRRGRA